MEILTKTHERFEAFCERLEGPEGCNFKEDENGKITWKCKGGKNKDFAEKILRTMEGIDVEGTLQYFEQHGGYCDCEIVFNV